MHAIYDPRDFYSRNWDRIRGTAAFPHWHLAITATFRGGGYYPPSLPALKYFEKKRILARNERRRPLEENVWSIGGTPRKKM